MHWKICKDFGIEVKERWHEHEPKAVIEKDSATILWDIYPYTLTGPSQDIVLKNEKDKTCLLIDMTISLDTNTSVKTTGKLNKYKDLNTERMWGRKTSTVPVVMGAFGTIKKGMENYTNKIPGNINIHELQKKKLCFLQSTFSEGSSPSSRNPLCLPKSMVWTRMLREKITARNYTSTSYIITYNFIKILLKPIHKRQKNCSRVIIVTRHILT